MAEWVLAVERGYVAAATSQRPTGPSVADPASRARAKAAAAAVASRYLAVGTPRSISFAFETGAELDEAVLTLEAHRTWFQPIDVRCARVAARPGAEELVARIGGRVVTFEEACAADIVNLHGASCRVEARHLRRGTHVNVLAHAGVVAPDARALATVVDEANGLAALAAGLVDGRQLDEITICFVGEAPIALAALCAIPAGT